MRFFSLAILFCSLAGPLRAEPLWFALQGVHKTNVPNSVLNDPQVAGLSIRESWKLLEPTDGNYDWGYLDAQVARARSRGKQYMIRVETGDDTPGHAYSEPLVYGIPQPDDPVLQRAYRDLHNAIAARYGSDVRLYAVHACGFEVCEWHLPGPSNDWWNSQFDMEAAFRERISAVREAFHQRVIVAVNHSPQPYSEAVLDWAETQDGVAAQMNALKATTSTTWEGYTLIVDYEQTTGWQFLGPSNIQDFGGPFQDAVDKGLVSVPAYFEFYSGDVGNLAEWDRCDLDGNGMCSVDEIDAVILEQVSQTQGDVTDRAMDLNSDGRLNNFDRDAWLTSAGYLAADANLDGVLDGLDFTAWNAYKFQFAHPTRPWQNGEWNGDGYVDGRDLAIWFDNNGQLLPGVPEPGTLSLLTIGLLAMRRLKSDTWASRSVRSGPPPAFAAGVFPS